MRQVKLFIQHMPYSDTFSHLKLSWNISHSDNVTCQPINQDGLIECGFDYVFGTELEETFVEYKHN